MAAAASRLGSALRNAVNTTLTPSSVQVLSSCSCSKLRRALADDPTWSDGRSWHSAPHWYYLRADAGRPDPCGGGSTKRTLLDRENVLTRRFGVSSCCTGGDPMDLVPTNHPLAGHRAQVGSWQSELVSRFKGRTGRRKRPRDEKLRFQCPCD